MLQLRLLGPIRINQSRETPDKEAKEKATHSVPRFRSRRTMALLGYLAAEQRPIAREFLATLFWPEEESSRGRTNLRRELHNLAQILPGCWTLETQAVAFVPSGDTTVDLYALSALEAEGHREEAAELLGGEFLEGLYLEDNLEFENWLLAERERWRGRAESILTRVIDDHRRHSRYPAALDYTLRLLQLTPWNEELQRGAMRLLAWTGKREAALRQFEQCKQSLWEELGVEPAGETIALYQQIEAGELAPPPKLPGFLTNEESRHKIERPFFVARQAELAKLGAHLKATLAGQSQIVFVTGGPGRGKTSLLDAFARQAMEEHAELLVASGNCNAYSGIGDPYLPFRDVMGMLTGDVEARWDAGIMTRGHARRLWAALPLVIQTLLDHGPHLLDVLVPGAALLSRVMLTEEVIDADVPRLRELVDRRVTSSQDVEQSYLFQEITAVLHTVAQSQPLLLILDDIQWADAASIGLLFHLGRRLVDRPGRVLIICAYRPEEIAFSRGGQRHPLAQALSEFKRTFGDVWLGLGPVEDTEGHKFVDELLNTEPNRLGENFRRALFHRTAGHPLFTVELLRDMQERGDLLEDEKGDWIESPTLNWEVLPARVEAVIEERIDRLDPKLQEMLTIASIEGEVFTAQVVAEVQKLAERSFLHLLSGELEQRHRLVREQEEIQTHQGTLTRYRFGHVLFQEYIYKGLGSEERRLLHGEVAGALEKLYAGQLDEMAVQLGHHLHKAEDYGRALPYFSMAAERAAHIHANDEAITHYTRAIELASRVSLEVPFQAKLHRGRGLVCETIGDFNGALADLERALEIAHTAGEHHLEWRFLLDLGKLWASRDYKQTHDYFEKALQLARDMKDTAVLAHSLNWMGNWQANAENPLQAAEYHQEALVIFEALEDQQGLAITLDLLGIAHLLGSDLSQSVGYYDRAIALFQELADRQRLISSLMGRGTTVSVSVLLATAPASTRPDALSDIQEATRIAREIYSPPEEAWAYWTLGLLYTMYGQFGQALEVMQSGLRIASEIGHREWMVGNRFSLGVLYVELLAPDEAQLHLEEALSLARGLQSQYWINHVYGALASAYCLHNDSNKAYTCLEMVLSPQTPMDTMGKRYCWVRRAELALIQGDSALALTIVDRLIASAPGLSPEGVITFLWKLKGETLAARGQFEEAESLLQAALNNARTQGEQFLLWGTYASLGQLYHTMNQQKEARQAFSTARELIGELADTVPDKALKDNFLQRAHTMLPLL